MPMFQSGRMTIADAASDANQQVTICQDAATAAGRGSPAAPGLSASCTASRGANIAAGNLVLDAMPVDATMRVNLMNTGNRIIAGEPALSAIAAKLAPEVRSGYAIGVKIARAAGGLNPSYAAKVRASLSATYQQGFDLAIASLGPNASNAVKAAAPASSTSTAVYVAGGVVLAVGIGALIYKFT